MAVRETLGRLHGAYALVVMHTAEPDRLIGARKDVPLIVGHGDGETFLASDVAAILAHTDRVTFLEDGDVADLRPSAATITDLDGAPVQRAMTVIDWSPEAAEKGGYEHFMLKEIHEQPESLSQAIAGRISGEDRIEVGELAGLEAVLRTVTRVEVIACGSAHYASLVGAAAIQDWLGIPARAIVGSEFRYAPPPLDERTLVIAVTQSGETADTIAPTRLARRRGCPVIAVTNTVGSAITREADAVLYPAGRPRSRRGGLEDVRDPGHDARHPGSGHRQDPRLAARSPRSRRSSPPCGRCRPPPHGPSRMRRSRRQISRAAT